MCKISPLVSQLHWFPNNHFPLSFVIFIQSLSHSITYFIPSFPHSFSSSFILHLQKKYTKIIYYFKNNKNICIKTSPQIANIESREHDKHCFPFERGGSTFTSWYTFCLCSFFHTINFFHWKFITHNDYKAKSSLQL